MEKETVSSTAHPDYQTEIAQIIKSNLIPIRMRQRLSDYHENDIALTLSQIHRDERSKLYSVLDIGTLTKVIEYAEEWAEYLGEISVRKRVEILSRMEISLAVEYLEGLEKKDRNMVMALMPEETRKEIELLTSFDKDEIGSKMTTNYISVKAGMDIRSVMSELIAQAAENDNVST